MQNNAKKIFFIKNTGRNKGELFKVYNIHDRVSLILAQP